jgi:hypothetical protein
MKSPKKPYTVFACCTAGAGTYEYGSRLLAPPPRVHGEGNLSGVQNFRFRFFIGCGFPVNVLFPLKRNKFCQLSAINEHGFGDFLDVFSQ